MSDLDLLTRLRPEVRLPMAAELAGARRRLVGAITAELASLPTSPGKPEKSEPLSARPFGRHRRRAVLGIAMMAAAIAAFAAILATGPSPGTSKPAIDLTAARFLDRASSAVLNSPATPPRPGQFVYSETETPGGRTTETWLSADGSGNGLIRGSAGSSSLPSCSIAQAEVTQCFPTVGYFPDLPTDPSAVLGYLNKIHVVNTAGGPPSGAPGGWEDNVIGKTVSQLLSSSYLLPAQQAAIYKLMAETPGFRLVPSMTDAIGRTGIGIEWTFEGGTAAVILDPTTYAYLGSRTWPEGEAPDPSAAYDGDALVRLAVVPSAGQQP